MAMKKLAMIGCGNIAEYHLDHLVQFKDIELAGFCDVLIDRAEAFVAKAESGKAYSDFVRMYDDIKPDMVFICIPPGVRGYVEFETIRRGIHMFAEKPLALDLNLGRDMVRRVKESGIIAAGGFQCRYDSINAPAREFIKKQPILHVAGSRVDGLPKGLWGRTKYTSGGQLAERSIHQMDIMRYLLDDDPVIVFSVASSGCITEEEIPGFFNDHYSTTLITFKSGTTATMIAGYYGQTRNCWDNKITFGTRTSRMDYKLISGLTIYDENGETTIKSERDPGLESDRTFVEAVISGDPSKIRNPYADAWKSVAFCLACNESMRTGQPVKVEY